MSSGKRLGGGLWTKGVLIRFVGNIAPGAKCLCVDFSRAHCWGVRIRPPCRLESGPTLEAS